MTAAEQLTLALQGAEAPLSPSPYEHLAEARRVLAEAEQRRPQIGEQVSSYVQVADLGAAVRATLESVRYGARDIEVIATRTVSLRSSAYSDGRRGFLIALNLTTGERLARQGDWGGANPWSTKSVDVTEEIAEIPENGVIVKGDTGYPRTFARIYCHPSVMQKMLPAPTEETTDEEQHALYCHACIKGGQYRRDEMARRRVQPATVDSLVERGYLTRNKAGSVQITTKGKNARDRSRVRF